MPLLLTHLFAQEIQVISFLALPVLVVTAFIINNKVMKGQMKLQEERASKDNKLLMQLIEKLSGNDPMGTERALLFADELREIKEELRQERLKRLRYTDINLHYLAFLVNTVDKEMLVNQDLFDRWEKEGQDNYVIIQEEIKTLTLDLVGETRMGIPIRAVLDDYIRRMNAEHNKAVIFICDQQANGVVVAEHLSVLLAIVKYAFTCSVETIVLQNDFIEVAGLPNAIIRRVKAAALLDKLQFSKSGDAIKVGFQYERELAST